MSHYAEKTEVMEDSYAGRIGKYLTFALGDEEYGLEILKVREIIGLMEITRVPRMPSYIRGVINLRGKVIPVIDLRRKFSMEEAEDTLETCVIVVFLGDMLMGVIVDRVSEVLDLPGEDIEETPDFGISIDTQFILGVGKSGETVIMLLDIDKVLTEKETEQVTRAGKPSRKKTRSAQGDDQRGGGTNG